jgi:hypothetical protein
MSRITDQLDKARTILKQREETYGEEGYVIAGNVMDSLFPHGVNLKGPKQFAIFVNLCIMLGKIARVCNNINNDGHQDSADDLINYSAILSAITEIKEQDYDISRHGDD